MSFGSGFGSTGGFSGFGNTANNNTTSTFGNNTASSGTGLFGGTATSGGFGQTGGTFDNNNTSSLFGAKPSTGFGNTATTSSGGGLFGGGATSTTGGFGGFGQTNNNNTGTAFGGGNTAGGGLFGNKGGFGANNTATGGSIFGGGASTTGGFGNNTAQAQPQQGGLFGGGGTATTGGFGSGNTATAGGFGGFGGTNNAATSNNGTASTPFQAFSEKDGTSNQTSLYQSITFQQPYQNKSFEELRTEDYLQGRRYGNSNGQAGSFGQNTGFGGSVFGGNNNTNANTSGGGLFGGNTSTSNTTTGGFGGFGANNTSTNTNTGFGNNSGGGLFGAQQNKPTGGLFGTAASSGTATGGFGSTAPASGGLFGSNNNQQSSGFGTGNASNAGGGLFGSSQTQNKPAFGPFGQSTTNTGVGFGNNTNTAGGGLFGNTANANTNTGGGLFGSNNQQQTQQNQGGGLFGSSTNTGGGGLFGSNQNKPATGGLFGNNNATNTNTGGGLFGSNNNQPQQNAGGGLFGSTTNTNAGGSLFGGNNQQQNKPGGLFGSSTTNTNTGGGGLFGSSTQNTGGGLFGSAANNNAGGSSLFGGGQQQQNKPGGLFGSTANTNNNAGNSLFGGSQNNQSNTGLFGSSTQNTNNNSLFGSTNQNSGQQQPNQLHASLTLSPYGNDQLFSSLGQSAAPVGPLATPLAGARPAPSRTPSLLSSTRLNSPIYTPRASAIGRQATYGFSYSNFGTPNSSFSSSLTPQASSLLKPTNSLGSALTSRLAKSMSMQNLRGLDTPTREGGSLLRPTPGSASSRYLETGSMRKLKIDRSLRQDLFAPLEQRQDVSPPLHKKVSFDNSAAGARQTDLQPNAANALVRTENDDDDASPAATRSQRPNGTHVEMQQVNGASLTDIPEDGELQRPASAPGTKRPTEKAASKPVGAGEYWSKPSLKELKARGRSQLQKVGNFVVGRHGIGKIQFSQADLSNTDLDQLYGGIVKLEKNSATVYPAEEDTPPRGQGLNVPSKIWLENSWPRSHSGQKTVLQKGTPAYEKHVRRFKKIAGTKFDRYEPETGTWVFDVDHFTTYELGEDDDDDDMTDLPQDSSGLSDAPTIGEQREDDTMQSIETASGPGFDNNELDDTFEFKHTARSNSAVRESQYSNDVGDPIRQHVSYDYDDPSGDEQGEYDHMMAGGLGFADDISHPQGSAVQAPSSDAFERQRSSMALDEPQPDNLAESLQDDKVPESQIPGFFSAEEPKPFRSILKPSTATFTTFASPEKLAHDSWEDQLQRTISPKKRDRQTLKNKQLRVLTSDRDEAQVSPFKRSMLEQSQLGQSYLAQKSAKKVGFDASTNFGNQNHLGKSVAFTTSMDIMQSLFEDKQTGKRTGVLSGFENPYLKKPRLSSHDDANENESQRPIKSHFANDATLVYAGSRVTPQIDYPFQRRLWPLAGAAQEVRFAGLGSKEGHNAYGLHSDHIALAWQRQCTHGELGAHFSPPRLEDNALRFSYFSQIDDPLIWGTASHLWDTVEEVAKDLIDGMDGPAIAKYTPQLRKDAFAAFWAKQMAVDGKIQLSAARSNEEKALVLLTMNKVEDAADVLLQTKDHRLAMMVAQLPGTNDSRGLMQVQINEWRQRNDWSEMSDAIRALYSILAGHVSRAQGKNGSKEDRCAELNIGEHFGFSWRQCFALRLFCGGHDTLDSAVQSYIDDLANGIEQVQPVPAWANEDNPADGRTDVVLGLLHIAFATRARPAELGSIFDPKAVSGSALDSRLAWQLAINLYHKGHTPNLPLDKLDRLTSGFAAELEMMGEFLTAIWVAGHLKDQQTREVTVQEMLFRNGGRISEDPAATFMADTSHYGKNDEETLQYLQSSFRILHEDLSINKRELWSAKAQYARAALQNPVLQAQWLIEAEKLAQAKEVILTSIAPTAVIEEDYDDLAHILDKLARADHTSGKHGIDVYRNFLELVNMNTSRKRSDEGQKLMTNLAQDLAFHHKKALVMWQGHVPSLEEKVAVVEMGKVLRDEWRNTGHDLAQGVSAAVQCRESKLRLFDDFRRAMDAGA